MLHNVTIQKVGIRKTGTRGSHVHAQLYGGAVDKVSNFPHYTLVC